ncbi:MAG TPA: MFS transporter [bacterium]|nr:MFS transporter [bacterium]
MTDADGLPTPQRYWAILTVAIALAMSALDGAIANVALPTIATDLRASAASSIWVVNAYQLAVMMSLTSFAALGDIIGYRRVYVMGLAVFTLASLLCALSHSLTGLALARGLQGFGAAGIMSVNAALVRFTYPRARLGQGIGLNTLVIATSSAAGPTVAAGVLAVASWPWLFLINVPLGAVAFVLAVRALPRTEPSGHRFDVASAVLSAMCFGLLIVGIDSLGHGFGVAAVAAELAGAGVLGTVLVRRQAGLAMPMVPVDLFRRPIFALSALTSVCSFTAQGLVFVALPFYFQDVLGRSQVETGLLMTPWPLAVAAIAPIAGRLADRRPAGVLGGVGLAMLSAGLVLVALLPAHPTASDIVWRMGICGFGFGFFQSPNNRAIISSVPRERSGSAGGVVATARLLGQTTGAALVALVFGLIAEHPGGMGRGTTVAVVLAACFAAIGAGVSSLRLVEFRDAA